MKNRIMNYQRHNGKWCIGTCIGLEYKYELNLKQKIHKGSTSNSENYMTLKQETTKAIEVLLEVMTIMEKQD